MATKKAKVEGSTVESYKQGTVTEKQKMSVYSKKMKSNVRMLQNDFKDFQKNLQGAALKMREEGISNMKRKVREFGTEIKNQITENKEAVSHIANNVKFFQSQIDKKKKDFQVYARGPFAGYIKDFWG